MDYPYPRSSQLWEYQPVDSWDELIMQSNQSLKEMRSRRDQLCNKKNMKPEFFEKVLASIDRDIESTQKLKADFAQKKADYDRNKLKAETTIRIQCDNYKYHYNMQRAQFDHDIDVITYTNSINAPEPPLFIYKPSAH